MAAESLVRAAHSWLFSSSSSPFCAWCNFTRADLPFLGVAVPESSVQVGGSFTVGPESPWLCKGPRYLRLCKNVSHGGFHTARVMQIHTVTTAKFQVSFLLCFSHTAQGWWTCSYAACLAWWAECSSFQFIELLPDWWKGLFQDSSIFWDSRLKHRTVLYAIIMNPLGIYPVWFRHRSLGLALAHDIDFEYSINYFFLGISFS